MGRKTLIKRVLAGVLLIALLALPAGVPALQPFIDPVHGVPGAALAAGLPTGTFMAKGIPGEATVVWDEHGVPHITATTDEAGAYALGWVTASQRLFQMDLLRRVGEGRLAELVGEKGLENDVFIRTIGLHRTLEETWNRIVEDPELQKLEDILLAYSRGVNDYIAYAKANNLLPLEYRVLRAEPENWTPVDSLAIGRVIALGLAWNDEDLVLAKLVERLTPQIVAVMDLTRWTGTVEQAPCSLAVTWGSVSTKPNAYDYTATLQPSRLAPGSEPPSYEAIHSWITSLKASWWRAGTAMASNNWVVNGSYTASGKPIVANDPHLELTVPPVWFLAEINTPSFKSIGALFPGVPMIVIGRNQHLAWAFTNVMGDFTDYYYYVWDGDRYLYKGEWLEASKRTEQIRVRDPLTGEEWVEEITVLETVHGPVLEKEGERLAVRWTGMDVSFEFQFFLELNNASTVVEAITAQRWFHVPIQNFVVADDQGNFAYSPVGAYPVRTNLPLILPGAVVAGENLGNIVNTGFLPFNGSNGEGEWAGYIPKEELPILYNPPLPYIATANSKPWAGGCGDFVGWHYADRYRQERIVQLLDQLVARGDITLEDMARVQNDILDLSIKDYLETAILPYSDSPEADMLREWLATTGPLMDKDSVEATLAMAWVAAYHELLWESLYGSTDDISFFRFHYALSIVRAAAAGDEYVRVLLDPVGGLAGLADEALRVAKERLSGYYGSSDPKSWVYGEIHYYNPKHPAFTALDYDHVPASGGPYTVSPARPALFDSEEGMPVRHGPSLRQLVDLASSGYWIAIPGGQSGNPYSTYYQDIYLDYWTKGTYLEYTLLAGVEGPRLEFTGGEG